jgi:hypothetical protein
MRENFEPCLGQGLEKESLSNMGIPSTVAAAGRAAEAVRSQLTAEPHSPALVCDFGSTIAQLQARHPSKGHGQ